jgi:predicted amidophosphoribosyltransferase
LKGQERRKSLKNIFVYKSTISLKGKTIILVDDIITTGTTMQECAKVLRLAGAKKVWGLAIAKG